MALLVGAAWHVKDVRAHAVEDAERTLRTSAARTARSIDMWIGERDGDATTLAEVAGIHGADSTNISPAIAGRILQTIVLVPTDAFAPSDLMPEEALV